MPERIKELLDRIAAWWKKFTTKQKTLMISITATVILALAILAYVMSRPTMVTVMTCEEASQAAKAEELLTGDAIYYEQSNQGLTFSVKTQDEAKARILLGSNNIPTKGYTIDDVTSGGFSTTEADKLKRYQVYLQDYLAQMLEGIDGVESATVKLSIPVDDGTMISRKQDTYAAVNLKLTKEVDEEWSAGVAKLIATSCENDTTDSVLILDSAGNLLFSGGDSTTSAGTASSQLSMVSKVENSVKSKVKEAFLTTSVYDNVSVAPHLVLDFDETTETDRRVYVEEGLEQGYLKSKDYMESNAEGGVGGTPGTDTNDGVTYVLEDGTITTQNVIDYSEQYDPSVKITETKKAIGTLDAENSSIAVVATNYVVYDEDVLKKDGTLNGMTFDEFIANNNERKKAEVDPSFVSIVSKATGIAEDRIEVTAYDVPFFNYSQSSGRTVTDYLQIALAVLIFGMLGYVVFRSTRKEETAEMEPELSVEALLETTREAEELDDIGFNEKSETRVAIEKFVDENPEAVASLLRNWLNEEWN